MKNFLPRKAFTLIELLIVVAIIAILAAIAVPNFLEAQTRAKVSRAKADMRSIATGLESYAVDSNKYPVDRSYWGNVHGSTFGDMALTRLTTPIAYLSSVPINVFPNLTDNANSPSQYRYFSEYWKNLVIAAHPNDPMYNAGTAFSWTLASSGPDRKSNLGEYLLFGRETFDAKWPNGFGPTVGPTCIYDPTNGTISAGDIVFVGPGGPVY